MYGKSFAQQFTGSMMGAGPSRFALWNYCIANADKTGCVEVNPPLVAALIGDTVQNIEDAIAYLTAPDPKSRTKDEGGRRLAHEGAFLYRIVNYLKYREIRTQDERRAYMRAYMRERRARVKVNAANGSSQLAKLAEAEGEGEAEAVQPPDGGSKGGAAPRPRSGLNLVEMLKQIPADWSDQRRKTAAEWAAYKQSKPRTADRYTAEVGWKKTLTRMGLYTSSGLATMVDKAIANGWQGWEHTDRAQAAAQAKAGQGAPVKPFRPVEKPEDPIDPAEAMAATAAAKARIASPEATVSTRIAPNHPPATLSV